MKLLYLIQNNYVLCFTSILFPFPANKRIVFDLNKNNIPTGVPDGMTIDTDGNLWIAVFNGSVVSREYK